MVPYALIILIKELMCMSILTYFFFCNIYHDDIIYELRNIMKQRQHSRYAVLISATCFNYLPVYFVFGNIIIAVQFGTRQYVLKIVRS